MLFISHANPEDNQFTQWIALQLVKNGYATWSDITDMLGGEDPWNTPEQAIRLNTSKFLYILSRSSNSKQGVLKELQVAENTAVQNQLTNFIVPLLIDDLPIRDANIRLSNNLAISFQEGWANGLDQLLKMLERDGVPKSDAASPDSVNIWWRTQFSADGGIHTNEESCYSNRLLVTEVPEQIYVHRIGTSRTQSRISVNYDDLPYPAKERGQNIISFAKAADFAGKLGPLLYIEHSTSFRTSHLLENDVNRVFGDRGTARRLYTELMSLAWHHMVRTRRLPRYQLSGGVEAFYFTDGLAPNNLIEFTDSHGKRRRSSIGYRNIKQADETLKKRYWHLAIEAKFIRMPHNAFAIRTHVAFSDDACILWDNPKRMHSARRRQCKNWFNGKWRDMMLCAIGWLAHGQSEILLDVGSDVQVKLSAVPEIFHSPVSYNRSVQDVSTQDEIDEELETEDQQDDETEDIDA